jgi:molybdopterin/thiamine biosynthesis adenylyltransferase
MMNSLSDHLHDRDIRQRELVPPERLASCHAAVIGVGAIGRQVALQLAAVGVTFLVLYDHDTVAVENLAAQGYRPDQLGQNKADATALDCQRINPMAHTVPMGERFRRSTASQITVGESSLVVFSCVDSITTRKLIWEAVRVQAALFLDGRMSSEVIRVLAVEHPATDGTYATTLFDAGQAFTGSCTARSTIYSASVAAGLMVGQLTRWLREIPVEGDVSLNLLSMELAVAAGSH